MRSHTNPDFDGRFVVGTCTRCGAACPKYMALLLSQSGLPTVHAFCDNTCYQKDRKYR
jgi:hypothetical protein